MIHNEKILRRRKLNRYKLFLLENVLSLSCVVLFSLCNKKIIAVSYKNIKHLLVGKLAMANIILICSLAAFGLIFVILLLLAGGYFWWRHKRSQLQFVEPIDDEESVTDSIKYGFTFI